jgi:hypothetical protein
MAPATKRTSFVSHSKNGNSSAILRIRYEEGAAPFARVAGIGHHVSVRRHGLFHEPSANPLSRRIHLLGAAP